MTGFPHFSCIGEFARGARGRLSYPSGIPFDRHCLLSLMSINCCEMSYLLPCNKNYLSKFFCRFWWICFSAETCKAYLRRPPSLFCQLIVDRWCIQPIHEMHRSNNMFRRLRMQIMFMQFHALPSFEAVTVILNWYAERITVKHNYRVFPP